MLKPVMSGLFVCSGIWLITAFLTFRPEGWKGDFALYGGVACFILSVVVAVMGHRKEPWK